MVIESNGTAKEFRKVLVLYIGGTIGMQKNDKGVYIPKANSFLEKVKYHSEMHDVDMAKKYFRNLRLNELVLPSVEQYTVVYEICEYKPLLDSSNMTAKDWIRIAKDIEKNYLKFDGFVVLHGTDTLAYTSSALSFMLDGLNKPVILTGSQIPIFETRSDAKDNFLSSLIIAGCYNIPEVCVFFANKLLRGNRTAKISSNLLDAFNSPNYHTLADVGISVTVNDHYVMKRRNSKDKPFTVHTNLNCNVAVLYLFPTITGSMLEAFCRPPLEGIVLQSYGVGNVPSEQSDILDALKEAVARRVLIVNVTQCAQGTVCSAYETGKALEDMGIVSGSDMTVEAALTKLTFVLGLPSLTYEEKVQMMRRNLRGELTASPSTNKCI